MFKSLELQLALRYDAYEEIGDTTNPKLAFQDMPSKDLLFRGSVNTGLRAPSPQQLNLGTVELATNGTIADPVKCPDTSQAGTNPSCTLNSIAYLWGGNPNLKPEISKQALLGMVFSPLPTLTASVDYGQVKLKDRIHNLTVSQQLANYPVFADKLMRDANGDIVLIQAGWINAGNSMTKGLDISATHSATLSGNTLTTTLSATKMISAKEQLLEDEEMKPYVGQWTNTTPYLSWKTSLRSTYKTPNISTTLSMNYSSGYDDEDHTTSTALVQFQKREIASDTTFNLVGNYTGFKDLTLGAGLSNLFDRDPPFTWHNVDNVGDSGRDPRGRCARPHAAGVGEVHLLVKQALKRAAPA